MHFPAGTKELNVSLYKAAIFFLFNDADKLPLETSRLQRMRTWVRSARLVWPAVSADGIVRRGRRAAVDSAVARVGPAEEAGGC
jgi:hypothetical protein